MTHVIRARWSRHVVQERIENIGSKFVCLSKRWSFFVWHWHSINKYCFLECSLFKVVPNVNKKIDKVLFFQKLLFYQCFTDDCTQNSYNASMEKGDFLVQQKVKKFSSQMKSLCGYFVLLLLPALLILASNRLLHSQLKTASQLHSQLKTASQVQRGNRSSILPWSMFQIYLKNIQ